jgi:hypothetical protein
MRWKRLIFEVLRVINRHLLSLSLWTSTWTWVIADPGSRPSTNKALIWAGDILVKLMLAHLVISFDRENA